MTTIYLDTNIFMNESFFRSAMARAFLKACSILHFTVVVPEVVVDEVVGNFPKKFSEKAAAFKKAQRELAKIHAFDTATIDSKGAIENYEDWLAELLDGNGVVIAPYPDVSAKTLVLKSYQGEKPFKETGEGHKDYLVWESMKAHINSQGSTPPYLFVTHNTNDFGATGKDGMHFLHPVLSEQIPSEADKPKLYTSLKSVFDDYLSPKLEGVSLEEIPDIDADQLQMLIDEHLLNDLPMRSAFGFENVPFSNDVSISSVGEAKITDISLAKLGDDIIVSVEGVVEIEVDGFVEKHSYYHDFDEVPDVYVVDADWNDHVMAVSTSVETAFEVRLFFSTTSKTFTAHEISLPEEIEDDWPYK
jgi:predicted nucleic acid-binding protein